MHHLKYKQKIMDEKEQQNDFFEEDQDEVISKIKTIASQIFTSFSDNSSSHRKADEDLNIFDFQRGLYFQRNEGTDRKYSYTDRCYNNQDQTFTRRGHFQHQNEQNIAQKQPIEKTNAQIQQKNDKNKQSPKNFKKKIIDQKASAKNSPANKPSKKKQSHDTQSDKKVQKVSNPPPLASSKFMEPIGHFKQTLMKDIYEKALKEELQYKENMAKKKSMRSLEEIYKQKQSLYERFIKDQYKKKLKMEESRVSAFEKQLQDFVGTPSINSNIQIKGSFDERSQQNIKKKEENKQKILYDSMKHSTFAPKTNSPKRYNKVESKVKSIWKPTTQVRSQHEQHSSQNLGDGMDLKGISQQLLRTGSFFSDESQNSPNKNKSFELKIKSVQQLSHILEIDDLNQE